MLASSSGMLCQTASLKTRSTAKVCHSPTPTMIWSMHGQKVTQFATLGQQVTCAWLIVWQARLAVALLPYAMARRVFGRLTHR
jgi:hypothetical protein